MELRAIVVDDDTASRKLACEVLRFDGWQVGEAKSVDEMSWLLECDEYQLLLCCAERSDELGKDALAELLRVKRKAGTDVHIIMTAEHQPSQTAVTAILNGASDFLAKPYNASEIRERSRAVIARLRAIEREVVDALPEHETAKTNSLCPEGELIGRSSAIVNVFKQIARSVQDNGEGEKMNKERRPPTYFISGETGTGKELVARLIHNHSRYRTGRFVPINCSNLTPELADAELFGSSPGAYTGAPREERTGLWEMASGGTLFLDEITEAPVTLLPKLLRVLQDGQIKRLGGKRWISVNVQVIAASNREIQTEIDEGRFRTDLYHRLSLYKLRLPSLKDRREDIPLLVEHFAERYSVRPLRFSKNALQLLMRYSWDGNVRELENVVRAAVTQSVSGVIYAVDLIQRLGTGSETSYRRCSCGGTARRVQTDNRISPFAHDGSLEDKVREFKLNTLKESLSAHSGNVTKTASALGMSRPSLYKLLKELKQEGMNVCS